MTGRSGSTALVVRDEEVLRLRLAGRPVRQIAREFDLTLEEVNTILDHALEQVSEKLRVRITALELARLDALAEVFFEKGLSGDAVAGGLAVKISERRSALLGLDFRHQDPVQLSLAVSPQPSSVDRIMEALNRIARPGA
jgi:hypothetical protein